MELLRNEDTLRGVFRVLVHTLWVCLENQGLPLEEVTATTLEVTATR